MDVDNYSSGTGTQSSASHPRRPPAHMSVSLRHTPQPERARSHEPEQGPVMVPPANSKRPTSSPSSTKPVMGKDDSGESSNAEKWFEKSNNYASRNSTSFVDNSPPFFLQNSSSDETPPNGTISRQPGTFLDLPGSVSLAHRNNLMHLGTDNGSTDDFRSVIDDLTIENKKLKRKLRTFEKLQDSHLKDQKLFEVRVHGLPAAKKTELEEILRKFALGLGNQPEQDLVANMYNSIPPPLMHNKSGSSSISNPFADSAYASNSASGQGSSSTSDSKRKQSSISVAKSRHQNIHSYLHDIPEGLLPRNPAIMTEKAKKKLVVRRLEQIFAGKGAVKTGNQQPQQQQEVSQLAATAERTAAGHEGAKAPQEGVREAKIMSQSIPSGEASEDVDAKDFAPDSKITAAEGTTKKRKLDQRPTRPLDLDPFRAQVPIDNFKYMKHLGFSPPGVELMDPHEDGHGWIYLNLLINMAQLHTINVTADFVRRSLQDHSRKFELSSDGRKIRWKGGKLVTKTSTDGENTPSAGGSSGPNAVSSERGSPRKRMKISQDRGSSTSRDPRVVISKPETRLSYTPLFHHRSSEDSDDSSASEAEDVDSPFPMVQAGDSSGMTSSGIKTNSTKKPKRRENGPIIFYNNAKFCTDLSGDAKTEDAMMYNAFLYHSIVQQPLGTFDSGSSSPAGSLTRGPLASAAILPEAMDLDDNPIPDTMELRFPPSDPIASQPPRDRKAIQFEVSGLGGVCPADNFTINVQSRHAPVDQTSAPADSRQALPSRYPTKIASLLNDETIRTNRRRAAFHKEILETRREDLQPSRLPDASCFMPAGDTSPEDDDESTSDAEDAMSVVPTSPDALGPTTAPQPIELDFTSSDESEDGDDEDDDLSDDGSLDLLAVARAIDPEAIRAREREYDANLAERLAEEIPAGSSAATAGGGSGFASPGSGVDREEWEAAKREAMRQREAAKRRRSEGMQG